MQLAYARWTPCAALVFGSVLFVLLTIALIPNRIGPIRPPARDPPAFMPHGAVANEPFQTPQASPIRVGSPRPTTPPPPAAASPQQNGINNAVVGSLFGSTPRMELPVAPPDPSPPPPPAEVPPPAPTPSIYELPAPPPPPVEPAPTVESAQTPAAAAPAPGAPQAIRARGPRASRSAAATLDSAKRRPLGRLTVVLNTRR